MYRRSALDPVPSVLYQLWREQGGDVREASSDEMCSLARIMIARQHSVSSFKGVRVRHPSSANKIVIRLREQEEESTHVHSVCGLFGS